MLIYFLFKKYDGRFMVFNLEIAKFILKLLATESDLDDLAVVVVDDNNLVSFN